MTSTLIEQVLIRRGWSGAAARETARVAAAHERLDVARAVEILRHGHRGHPAADIAALADALALQQAGIDLAESRLADRYEETDYALWDRQRNQWSCRHCGRWTSGAGVNPLARLECRCGAVLMP